MNDTFTYPSQARKASMEKALTLLDAVPDPVICEVGRARHVYAGESDGHSTLAFNDYLCGRGGDSKLYSVDIDLATQAVCQQLCAEHGLGHDRIRFINSDAIRFFVLEPPDFLFDLLYLDGWDLNYSFSARKHLICFMLAEPHVKPGGLVLVDDTGLVNLGKGELVVPVAGLMGWEVVHQGYQTLLRKPIL